MSNDIASLGLEVDTSPMVRARDEFGRFVKGASAAERAAQAWGMTTSAAARQVSTSVAATARTRDEFGRFVKTVSDGSANVARASAATMAGMNRASMATYAGMSKGAVDYSSIVALMASKLANDNKSVGASFAELATSTTASTVRFGGVTKIAEDAGRGLGGSIRGLLGLLGPLAAAFTLAGAAMAVWRAGMKAADLGEQAEQLNVSTEALQAYRYEAAQAGIADGQLDQALIRLTASLGAAYKGGEEQIKMFDKLGVKVLDANGELRSTQDILPELAAGLKNVGSETQRNAILTELFGRSGARMATMLDAWATGNEAVIASAKKAGAVLDKEVIKAWDDLSDAMTRAGAVTDTAFAKLGAPIATWALEKVESILKSIISNLDRLKKFEATTSSRAAESDVTVLEERLKALDSNPSQFGVANSRKALTAQIEAAKARVAEAKAQERQVVMQADEEAARSVKLPAMVPPPTQAIPKSSGGKEDPYAKLISGAQAYIAQKNAETQALGMNGQAAALLIHTQELLNKAMEGGIKLTAGQRAQLEQLAAKMAEADTAFKSSEFMKNSATKSQEFVKEQELERQAIGMSAEAAARMRFEQEMLNQAQSANIVLTQAQREEIGRMAGEMASAQEKTRQAKEMYEFAKGTFKGMMSDINQGVREGAGVWNILGNAAMNVLGKISDKLMEMAANELFEAAFPSKGGGGMGGGIMDIVGGLFGGGGMGGTSSGIMDGIMGMMNFFPTFAKGGVFDRSRIVPFAHGGIIDKPTLFPFAKGTGVMGEAGPEAIMPLRRGRNGALGVVSNGSAGNGKAGGEIVVRVELNNDVLTSKIDNRSTAIVKKAAPGIEARAVERSGEQVIPIMSRDKEEGHGDWRTQ